MGKLPEISFEELESEEIVPEKETSEETDEMIEKEME